MDICFRTFWLFPLIFNIKPSLYKLEAQWAEPVSLTFHSALRKLNIERPIYVSYKVSIHFGKAVSDEKIFRNRPIRNKNCVWRPRLLMDRNEMSNSYRGPSIDASYQVSVHLAQRFQRRSFFLKFRYLYRDNCILNTNISIFKQELSFF